MQKLKQVKNISQNNQQNQQITMTHLFSKKQLIPYIVGCENSIEESLQLMLMYSKYCDVIEVGVPFSDPVADGPIIQAAIRRALDKNVTINDVFELIKKFRTYNKSTKIVLMGYFNSFFSYGEQNLLSSCKNMMVDGLIICDLPFEESVDFSSKAEKYQVSLIPLITPLTNKDRMLKILSKSSIFVYFVSVYGTTGGKEIEIDQISENIKLAKQISTSPIVIGFGIKNPKKASEASKISDGVVVGSYFVDLYNNSKSIDLLEKEVQNFTKAILQG